MAGKQFPVTYSLVILLAVLFTWFIHEFAHWLTGELLGYSSVMRINGTAFLDGTEPTGRHRIMVSAAGPIATVLQGWIAFRILRSGKWRNYIYALLFTAFYMRLLAGLMNFIHLNDEGRISAFLGIGVFTLPAVVTGILFFMVYRISKTFRPGWKFQLATLLTVMVWSSILILADQFWGIRIL